MLPDVIEKLRGGLIVSCQAPAESPLCDPYIIAAFALTAAQYGAAGVRINSAAHVAAVRRRVSVPIIGIEKVVSDESEVYITPTFDVAARLAESGADIIALDATRRPRPREETLETLIRRIHDELKLPVMADVALLEEGLHAAARGADIVATTLCGYTEQTLHIKPPDFGLVRALAESVQVPVICEGGVRNPAQARAARNAGAFAVVVGGAITGTDQLVREYVGAVLAAE
ncbi:MAG: N-acetylmannosamine-6-phosphate 2-epimerase [Blastocatellia bacterium]